MRSRRATGFCVGVLAEFFLPGLGRLDFPDRFHLFAAIDFLHELVVEGVARLFVFGGPDDGFGGVGEIAAGEIGRRIGLDPGNVIEKFEAEMLHGESDGVDDVRGAGNPDGAVGLEDALAGGEPGAIEFMVGVSSFGFVPITFVDGDHFSGVAGDSAVGEEMRRVGEDEVEGVVGDVFEDFEAIAVVEADVVFGVLESDVRLQEGVVGGGWKFGHELRAGWSPFEAQGELALRQMMINGDR